MDHVTHTFEPVFDENSRILILGTMPSPKSREKGFYYSHPQNRFWRVLAEVLVQPLPATNDEKKAFLLKNRIALWDVLASCSIRGASDQSIRDPLPNDLRVILSKAPIRAVFTTGKTATGLYEKYCEKDTCISPIYLPSTSPANIGHYTFQDLLNLFAVIQKYL